MLLKLLTELAGRFNHLSVRERVLILCTGLFLFYSIWNFFFLQPLERMRLSALSEQQAIQNELKILEKSFPNNITVSNDTIQQNYQTQLTQLYETLREQQKAVQKITKTLIPPEQMTNVIENLLRKQVSLKLIKLQNLVAQSLLDTQLALTDEKINKPAIENTQLTNTPMVYKHGLSVEFSGTYLDTLAYLSDLEKANWKFYWDELQIETENYPILIIKMKVYTLSLTADWLGVEMKL